MICSYCQTENSIATCSFCGADLQAKRPTRKEYIHLEQAENPQPILTTYHTYDLLILLRLVRQERTKAYNLMRTLQKAPEGAEIDSSTISFAEEEYRLYTARMKVIEGILIDRMGYKPKRVDDKLLNSLKMKIERERENVR